MVDVASYIDSEKPGRWYAELFDSIPAGIYRTTLEGQLVFCNKAFAQLFGFASAEELTGYPVIKLYKNQKDRGILIETVFQDGLVTDFPLSLIKRDGTPLRCAVTAKAGFDEDGMAVYLDGVIKDITEGFKGNEDSKQLGPIGEGDEDFVLLLSPRGDLLDINQACAGFLGYHNEELIGNSFLRLIAPQDRYLLPLFLSDVLQSGQEEGVLTIIDRHGMRHYLGFHALLVKQEGNSPQIRIIAHDATERMKYHIHQLSKQKLLGVMEMAGGVAHKLNQPLTIISNLLNEVLADLSHHDRSYEKLVKIDNQIKKLNEIARKIGAVNKYEAMEYVAGVRIVDIDKASRVKRSEEIK